MKLKSDPNIITWTNKLGFEDRYQWCSVCNLLCFERVTSKGWPRAIQFLCEATIYAKNTVKLINSWVHAFLTSVACLSFHSDDNLFICLGPFGNIYLFFIIFVLVQGLSFTTQALQVYDYDAKSSLTSVVSKCWHEFSYATVFCCCFLVFLLCKFTVLPFFVCSCAKIHRKYSFWVSPTNQRQNNPFCSYICISFVFSRVLFHKTTAHAHKKVSPP